MATTKNLIPVTERSKEEARELSRRGGIKSGESRRRKRTIRDTMEMLLTAPLSADESAELEKYGLDGAELDRRAALAVSVYKKAIEGDCKAFAFIADMINEHSETQEEKEENEAERKHNKEMFSSILSNF